MVEMDVMIFQLIIFLICTQTCIGFKCEMCAEQGVMAECRCKDSRCIRLTHTRIKYVKILEEDECSCVVFFSKRAPTITHLLQPACLWNCSAYSCVPVEQPTTTTTPPTTRALTTTSARTTTPARTTTNSPARTTTTTPVRTTTSPVRTTNHTARTTTTTPVTTTTPTARTTTTTQVRTTTTTTSPRTTTTTTARTTTTTIAWTTTQPALELGLLAWAIVATIMLVFIVVTASIVCYCRNRRKQYQQVPGRDISLSGVELYTLTPSPVTHSVPDPITPESLDDTPPIIQVSSPIARRTRSKKKLHFEEEV